MNPIALAIPAFLGLILLEALIARARGRAAYRFNDAIANLGCGVSNQVISSVFTGALRIAAYVWVYVEYRLWDLDALGVAPWAQWVLGIVGVDFLFYWFHRANHHVSALWAGHVVHHQSEDFNLAVALRQPWITRTTALPLFLVLGLIGLPPHIYLASIALNSFHQFWIHTELIGKLGPLEWVLNTPSHHRVHHAVNGEYVDRNYGGMFIVWDRLFGTFVPEQSQPVYGTIARFDSFNPVWANLYYFGELVRRSRAQSRWLDKVKVWLLHPGWHADGRRASLSPTQVHHRARSKFSPDHAHGWVKPYIVVQLLLAVAAVAWLLLRVDGLELSTIAAAGTWVVLATVVWAGLLEGRRWAWPLEVARLLGGLVWLLV